MTHVYGGESSPAKVIGGERVVAGMTVAPAARRIAFVASSLTSPGEVSVAAIDGTDERQLTDLCAEALPDLDLFLPEERTFTAPDGTSLHGWILRDPAVGERAPLLLDIHGGPHNAWGPAFDGVHLYHQTL